MDAAVRSDVADPRSLAVRQLSEPAPEDVVLGQPGEFWVGGGQGLEQRVVYYRLLGLLRPLLGLPAAGLEQGRDLHPRIEVLDGRELREQLRPERSTPCFPISAQLLGGGAIERRAVGGDLIADGGDDV